MKLGLCISGGGARGYAAVPMIEALLAHKFTFSHISGCSIGSIVGAYFALHGEVKTLRKKINSLTRRDYLRLIDFHTPRVSLIKGNKVKKLLDEIYGSATFSDTKLPLTICATDIHACEPAYFKKGKIVDVIMASSAIPGVFPPYKIGKKYYVDGAVTDCLPVRPLFEQGIDKVIAIDLNHLKGPFNLNILDILTRSVCALECSLAQTMATDNVYLIRPQFDPRRSNIFCFHNSSFFFRLGNTAIRNEIKGIKRWLHA